MSIIYIFFILLMSSSKSDFVRFSYSTCPSSTNSVVIQFLVFTDSIGIAYELKDPYNIDSFLTAYQQLFQLIINGPASDFEASKITEQSQISGTFFISDIQQSILQYSVFDVSVDYQPGRQPYELLVTPMTSTCTSLTPFGMKANVVTNGTKYEFQGISGSCSSPIIIGGYAKCSPNWYYQAKWSKKDCSLTNEPYFCTNNKPSLSTKKSNDKDSGNLAIGLGVGIGVGIPVAAIGVAIAVAVYATVSASSSAPGTLAVSEQVADSLHNQISNNDQRDRPSLEVECDKCGNHAYGTCHTCDIGLCKKHSKEHTYESGHEIENLSYSHIAKGLVKSNLKDSITSVLFGPFVDRIRTIDEDGFDALEQANDNINTAIDTRALIVSQNHPNDALTNMSHFTPPSTPNQHYIYQPLTSIPVTFQPAPPHFLPTPVLFYSVPPNSPQYGQPNILTSYHHQLTTHP